jgi:hypothetical protein
MGILRTGDVLRGIVTATTSTPWPQGTHLGEQSRRLCRRRRRVRPQHPDRWPEHAQRGLCGDQVEEALRLLRRRRALAAAPRNSPGAITMTRHRSDADAAHPPSRPQVTAAQDGYRHGAAANQAAWARFPIGTGRPPRPSQRMLPSGSARCWLSRSGFPDPRDLEPGARRTARSGGVRYRRGGPGRARSGQVGEAWRWPRSSTATRCRSTRSTRCEGELAAACVSWPGRTGTTPGSASSRLA